MKTALRNVLPEDEEWLVRLYASTRDDLNPIPEAQRRSLIELQCTAQRRQYEATWPGHEYLIILCDGRRIGRLIIARGTKEIHLIDIALLPEFRNQGIGGDLIAQCVADGNRAGLPVRLSVRQDNPALRLYHRLGFVITDDSDAHYKMEVMAPVSAERK